MKISLTIKLIIYFLLISTSSIFIVGQFSYKKTKKALINRTFDQLISVRVEKEKRLRDFFNQCSNDLDNVSALERSYQILANLTSLRNEKIINTTGYLLGYLQAEKKYNSIIFIDTSNNIIQYNINKKIIENNLQLFDNQQFVSFCDAIKFKNENFLSELPINNEHYIFTGKKVYSFGEKLLGIIILEISYQSINDIMFEDNIHNGLGKTGEVYLVGDDFLMRSSSRFIRNSQFQTRVKTEGVVEAFLNKQSNKIIKDYRNIDVFSSFKKLDIPELNWVILAEIDKNEAMKPINNVENNIVYMSLLVSLLLLGIIAALSSNITSPIKKLQVETEKIYQGKYGQVIDIKCNNEIGDLIRNFNKMSIKLKEQADRIEYEQVIKSSYIIDGQELERQRLSRELHDGLGQYLLAIKLKIEQLQNIEPQKQKIIIAETKKLFAETIKEIRNISNNLMPAILNKYGLIQAVENMASSVNNDDRIQFIFKSNIRKTLLSKKTQIYIFRIIQEALNNAIKHSQANSFSVNFIQTDENFEISISDNGKGTNLSQKRRKLGNGLENIKERVNLLSGKINIFSEINKGFKIDIIIPL